MKKLLNILLFVLVTLAGCEKYDDSEIWNKLKEHEERISRLEALCRQFNDNIGSLQSIVTALGDNDYITNVAAIMEGGKEIGYTITFSQRGAITIYHGKDGADGDSGQDGQPGQPGINGTDGQSPLIGVRKDADEAYYWTLNGEWLLDEDGNRISAAGRKGEAGADGEDGADGKDGITPQLKIEEDYWHVSYDKGVTWQRLDKAVGEDGKDGDSMFRDVEVTDYYVIITLADDTVFKIPTWKAFEELSALVNQLNSNLCALHAVVGSLQDNDYITGVVAISEGGKEIGYTISFSKSGPVTIYHGKNGQDGQNGQNGQDGIAGVSPLIGVKRDTDGTYYWTLNGEWLLDEGGNKIHTTGRDGENGIDGNDGITPQFKIEEDYWHVSYDKGVTWQRMVKAVGEDGTDGDSMFSNVVVTEQYVVVTLADNTVYKVPTWKTYEELKAAVDLANTNISSLETIVSALQDNDYVTGVVPQMDGSEVVGYILTFAKSGTVAISNGKDGENGIDGSTPAIGVKEGEGGIYYWTLDGDWLKDQHGNRIPTTGSEGAQGDDGITPQLKIESEYWYVSYDNAQTWNILGKAVGEDGENGDSFFKEVNTGNPDYVVITLADETVFTLLTSTGVSHGEPGDVYASAYGVVPGVVDMDKMTALMSAAAGKTIRFNSGEYVFPAHITVPSDISFVGNTKTVFKLADDSGSNVLFYIVSANNVTISRLFIDGGEDKVQPIGNVEDILDGTNAGNRYGIYCMKSRRIKIYDVEVYGWSLCGLYCENNDSGGGEDGRFYHAIELENSSFYYNYYGVWYAQYGEYNKADGCNFGDNFIGVRNDGGNNMYVGCFFNSNYCGFALNGNGIINESHGGCYSCTYNHNAVSGLGGGIAIYANKSTVGWNFTGQNIWYGAVILNDCKGIIFDSNIWGNVQFRSTSTGGLKNQNIVTNTYFHTDAATIMSGNDGSTYFDMYLPGGIPSVSP